MKNFSEIAQTIFVNSNVYVIRKERVIGPRWIPVI